MAVFRSRRAAPAVVFAFSDLGARHVLSSDKLRPLFIMPAADESHFGRFTGQYHAGTYLFDIHPPLGKLVFYWVGLLTGYDYKECSYANITDVYGPKCKFMVLRATSALFGAGILPLMYLIARQWGASVRASLLAALLLNFDGLNLMESRYILMDAQLMFWCAACLYGAQRWWARLNASHEAELAFFARFGAEFARGNPAHCATDPRLMSAKEHYSWLVGIGYLCAQAVAIKWTGLATPGMIAIESFFGIFFLRKPINITNGFVIAAVAFVVYAFYFYLHFHYLPRTGDGDGFMRLEYQRTLQGNPNYDANASRPPFLVNFFQVSYRYRTAQLIGPRATPRIRHPNQPIPGMLSYSHHTPPPPSSSFLFLCSLLHASYVCPCS